MCATRQHGGLDYQVYDMRRRVNDLHLTTGVSYPLISYSTWRGAEGLRFAPCRVWLILVPYKLASVDERPNAAEEEEKEG